MSAQDNDNYPTAIIPTLSVKNGADAVEFYKKAFEAVELMCITGDDGSVVAELSIGGARFFLADASPEHGNFSPHDLGGISVRMGLLCADPDGMAQRAIAAGATEIYPVADQDYGYRLGHIVDPFGHHWEICRPLSSK
jgi:PhnB protein